MRLSIVAFSIVFLLAGCESQRSLSESQLTCVCAQKAVRAEDLVSDCGAGLPEPPVKQPKDKPVDDFDDYFDYDEDD